MNKKPLEIYVHIPFCARKCLYCDFLSFRTLADIHEEYVTKLLEEIRTESLLAKEYEVVSIFFGGGTPSILEPVLIRAVMEELKLHFDIAEDAEITIEANPGTLQPYKLDVYRGCGINRISLGLQSADNRELKALGRIHTFEEFLKSYQRARLAGFSNINVDLMSALPGQTLDSWKNTLKRVIMLKPEHISAYSLIIEEGTPFGKLYGDGRRGIPPLPDEDTERQMYHMTNSMLEAAGYHRYEISNFAKPGFECRHNTGYWTGVPYIGLGLGASSYFRETRYKNESDLDTYLKMEFLEDSPESFWQEVTPLSRKEQMEEFMFLGLRMSQGISETEFIRRFGVKFASVYGDKIGELVKNGLMKQDGSRVMLTDWGMDISNYVMGQFLLEDGTAAGE